MNTGPLARIACGAAAAAAVVLLGACGSPAPAAAPLSSAADNPSSSSPAAAPSPSPTHTARLTIAQARRRYQQIVVRFNRTGDRANTDWDDAVPVAQYHRDLIANSAASRAFIRALRATRWPRRVQPYAEALASINLASNIRCNQAILRGQTYAAMETINVTDQDCTTSNGLDNVNALRQILGLPEISN